MPVIGKIISGGQTGADIAGLKAARRAGIPTGGTAPKGYRTERGDRRALLQGFGLVEHGSEKYTPRTAANVAHSDLTLIIARHLDQGSGRTAELCRRLPRPYRIIEHCTEAEVAATAEWLVAQHRALGRPLTLNIAGNRESRDPGIERRAMAFLITVLQSLPPAD